MDTPTPADHDPEDAGDEDGAAPLDLLELFEAIEWHAETALEEGSS